jgi:hypothetical protein
MKQKKVGAGLVLKNARKVKAKMQRTEARSNNAHTES